MLLEEFMNLKPENGPDPASAASADPAAFAGELDFSTVLSPLGMPPQARQAYAAGAAGLERIPAEEEDALRRAIAARERVDPAQVVCGAGRVELLRRLLTAIRPLRTVLPAPCPAAAEQAFAAMNCPVSRCMLWETKGFAMGEAFAAAVNTGTDLAYLPQPCDPTGRLAAPDLAFSILEKCAHMGAYLIADEALLEFADAPAEHSLLRYVTRYPNLIVLKSFSCIYAMPGVRLAYCITANPVLLEKLHGLAPLPVVTAGACRAGTAALQNRDLLQRARVLIHAERPRLAAALQEAGLTVYPSDANFLLVRSERPGLAGLLAAGGVRIKECGGHPGLSEAYCRVAIRSPAENAALVQAVKKALGG